MTITREEALRVALECTEATRLEYEHVGYALGAVGSVEARLREAFAAPPFDRATAKAGDDDPDTGWFCAIVTSEGARIWMLVGKHWHWNDRAMPHRAARLLYGLQGILGGECPTLDEAARRVREMEGE